MSHPLRAPALFVLLLAGAARPPALTAVPLPDNSRHDGGLAFRALEPGAKE